jgi:small nuclear ribonucleoprotein (snRNP)-like protein
MTYINVVFSKNDYEDIILQINAERANNNTIEYNEKLLKMTLKDIFSVPISTKNGKKYKPEHNINVLDKIYKEQNPFVNNVLDSTFLECIKHFRGSEYKYALDGLEKYYNITLQEIEEKYEEDYVKKFKKVLLNYETKIKKMQSKKEQI